jgi:4-amino-4-deoxy-L-arabinose transferase-like glycosyltransferase
VSHEWIAPIPPSPEAGDDEFVPLEAPPPAESSPIRLIGLALAIVVTIALLVLWRVAEVKIVDDDPWEHWDLVWFAAAGASIVALTLWGVAIVRYLRQRP